LSREKEIKCLTGDLKVISLSSLNQLILGVPKNEFDKMCMKRKLLLDNEREQMSINMSS